MQTHVQFDQVTALDLLAALAPGAAGDCGLGRFGQHQCLFGHHVVAKVSVGLAMKVLLCHSN